MCWYIDPLCRPHLQYKQKFCDSIDYYEDKAMLDPANHRYCNYYEFRMTIEKTKPSWYKDKKSTVIFSTVGSYWSHTSKAFSSGCNYIRPLKAWKKFPLFWPTIFKANCKMKKKKKKNQRQLAFDLAKLHRTTGVSTICHWSRSFKAACKIYAESRQMWSLRA